MKSQAQNQRPDIADAEDTVSSPKLQQCNVGCQGLITDAQYNEAFENLYEYEKEINYHNDGVLKSFGKTAFADFQKLIEDCRLINKIEFVGEPMGASQDEDYGIFKNVFIDQYSVGDSGDSFAGHIYANVNDKWIKVYYEC